MVRHVYVINCDCASYYDCRRAPVQSGKFCHCRFCRKQLGFEAEYLGRFVGNTEGECIGTAKASRFTDEKLSLIATDKEPME